MQHTLQSLLKADADAAYYFYTNQKEMAFKVLQERVYPALEVLRQQHITIPALVSTVAGKRK